MPITALPQETVRSIGSTQILTDAYSVVKELIDNSLDAHALAIFIEVSVNSLDVIQVKDNGPGIHPNDRVMLGKPHCTSKIRSLADLSNIGGKSLGFRGEALASVAAICGSMVLSKRVDSEPRGVSLTIDRQGKIEKEERISLPIGTIVRLTDFLKNIPVRREAATKASAKSLKNIKKLLQAYAFARPSVRFSFRVLKAKNDQGDWAYVPTRQPTASDVAVKVVGKKVVNECQWKSWNSNWEENPSDPEVENDQASYKFEAILPTPSCGTGPSMYDSSIVSNAGQYISIDSRPVSGTRGSLKHIISTYKSYLRSGSSVENFHGCKDPFLYLHIICPSGSYDVNVEPAKNDVLFADADFVIAKLERFLSSVYGELQTPKAGSRPIANSRPGDFDMLLARKPRPTDSRLWTADCRGRRIPSKIHNLGEQVEDHHDHHAIDSNTVLQTQDYDEEAALRDVRISNPWIFAKINASVRHESRRTNNQLLTPARQADDPTDDKRLRLQEHRQSHVPKYGLPSPARTEADRSPPSRAQQPPAHNPFSSPQKASRKKNHEHAPTEENTSQREHDAAGVCDLWAAINKPRNNLLIPSRASLVDHEIVRGEGTRPTQARGLDFVSARTLPLDAPLNGVPELRADRNRRFMPRQRLERTLKTRELMPRQPLEMTLKNGCSSSEGVFPNVSCARSGSNPITDSSLIHPISPRDPDLVASKDDERRKQGTLQSIQRLKSMAEPRTSHAVLDNSPASGNTIPSPHKSGQTLQACYLLENTPTAAPPSPNSKAIFEQGDPRAYLLDSLQQHNYNNNEIINLSSSAHHRLSRRRRKTSLLPLETVREEVTTRDLVLVIPTTKLDIHSLFTSLRSTTTTTSEEDGGLLLLDEYIASGKFVTGLPFSSSSSSSSSSSFFSSESNNNNNDNKSSMLEVDHYESKIRALLANVYGDEIGTEDEKSKFSSDLRAKLLVSSST